ncbi:hypothetical protein [Photobacterium atrarenae]|uniref:D-Tyr-tRNAtyr deacylase n=1 Tax=Photobacterium atrarenae TaxID=865757 RepID=A0ABY5GIZ9_9GAMM|nr:hypothetical protein [Photobacterium atrarenae]UTV28557.1 hypothetical protein NNL38_04735 [Photobacterium atrarenae]
MKTNHPFFKVLAVCCLILAGCGGGGSSSSDPAPVAPTKPSKQPRHILEAADIRAAFSEDLIIHPEVSYLQGELQLALVDSQPEDIAQVTRTGDGIQVFAPGNITIRATDTSTVFENSEVTFSIDVDKGINHLLQAQDLSISFANRSAPTLQAMNYKGTVSYQVADESQHLLAIDAQTGEITPLGVGVATVIISDTGNDLYAPATTTSTVTITPSAPGSLSFAPLNVPYSPNRFITPWRVNGDDFATYRYQLNAQSAPDVIRVDQQTGLIEVLGVGEASVDMTATYSSGYRPASRSASFTVTITEGERLALEIESQTFSFVPDKIITPNVRHAISQPTYSVESGDGVMKIDPVSGLPQMVGTGMAQLRAVDHANSNYPASEYNFIYTVNKGVHPGLPAETIIRQTYEDGLTLLPELKGQYGQLSLTGDPASVAINGETIQVLKAGKTTLTVTDSGGQLFQQSAPASLTLDIGKAPHPPWSVDHLTMDYQPSCVALSSLVSGEQGVLNIAGNSQPDVARFDPQQRCIQILKPGSTDFSLYSEESQNYLASAPKTLSVIIAPADAALSVSGDVSGIYGSSKLAPPRVDGSHGILSYSIDAGAAQDVVSIDPQSGQMTIRNAGTTRVKVSDSGDDRYLAAETYFNVTVKPAVNSLAASYAPTQYQPGTRLLPQLENVAPDMTLTFSLQSQGDAPVNLLNTSTGELEVLGAGSFEVLVSTTSRNFAPLTRSVQGLIEKAAHPGIRTTPITVNYAPLKTIPIEISEPAIGKRIYAEVGDSNLIDVDHNSGVVSLLDYQGASSAATVKISENDGDKNHYPLVEPALQQMTVLPPNENESHRDITLTGTGTIFESRLNRTHDSDAFRHLKNTRIGFAGVRNAPANEKLITQHGIGQVLMVDMIPEGEEDNLSNRKPLLIYVQRFDGCPDQYHRDAVANGSAAPIALDEYISCAGEQTNRFLSFIVLDDTYLTPGNWQAVVPFVVYRQSERAFKPTALGGCYQGTTADGNYEGCPEDGQESPSRLNEWNRVDIRLTK